MCLDTQHDADLPFSQWIKLIPILRRHWLEIRKYNLDDRRGASFAVTLFKPSLKIIAGKLEMMPSSIDIHRLGGISTAV